jgi:hypothetical protein
MLKAHKVTAQLCLLDTALGSCRIEVIGMGDLFEQSRLQESCQHWASDGRDLGNSSNCSETMNGKDEEKFWMNMRPR